MSHELNFPPNIENRLAAHAERTGQDVVHLIQIAVSRFVEEEVPDAQQQEWTDELNRRRCELIDKDLAGTIAVEERAELGVLQRQAERYFDRVAPPDIATVQQLHATLLSKISQIDEND